MRLEIRGVSWGAWVLALALVACSGQVDGSETSDVRDEGGETHDNEGSSGGDEPGDVPDGCEDVLVLREELPDCGSAGCRIIEETPERVVEWWIYIEGDRAAGDELAWHRLDCVQRQAEALGLTLVDSNGGDVVVVASYEAIASVIHTTAIEHIEAVCPTEGCACSEYQDEAACEADPLCAPVSGQRLDTGSACPVFVECVRYDSFCVSFTPTLDEDGTCWRFPSGCVPEGFTSLSSEGTAGCTDGDFEALPPCSD